MKDTLLKTVKDFFFKHWTAGKPVLLGFSGGVDSQALFLTLQELQQWIPLQMQLVHLDHGWREESALEAADLKKKVEDLGYLFHTKRMVAVDLTAGSLEEKARLARYQFFKQVYHEVDAQALILAHQLEDQAETVLKRIFEGAHLTALGGMRPVSFYEEMVIWRPLLLTSREDLKKKNHLCQATPLIDSTNRDLRFLRARLREKVFPELEQWFGKQIKKNLCKLGEQASCLREDLEKKLEPVGIHENLGSFLPFHSLCEHLTSFEKGHLLRLFLQKRGVVMSYDCLQRAIVSLERKSFDEYIDVSKGVCQVHGGDLFWFSRPLVYKEFVEVSPDSFTDRPLLLSCLKGEVFYTLPVGKAIEFISYEELDVKQKKRVSQYFAKQALPPLCRKALPLPLLEQRVLRLESVFFPWQEENARVLLLKI